MPRPKTQSDAAKLYTLVLIITSVAILYLAREILIPLALATLLAFILAPSVARLQRLKLGRIPSVLIVVGAVFVLIVALGWIVTNQLATLAGDLPRYESNLVSRIEALKQHQDSVFSRIEGVFKRLDREIRKVEKKSNASKTGNAQGPDSAVPAATGEATEVRPLPVQIVNNTPTGLGIVTSLLPEAFGALATLGIVIVFLIFMLLARDDLRNRLIQLIGPHQLTVTTRALDDAASRVSRYLRAQLIINASYGVMMAGGLYLVGLPNALMLGLLGGILRYVPYVGPWLGAGLGILLSVAESPPGDWSQPLIVLGLYLAAELLVNNVMEPLLYQSSTGVSTMGIIVAAMFWTWLWGATGLVLSMPLTVCIVVLGRYVPQLEFLHVMLSDTEVLSSGAQLYQRLLVNDEDEPREIVEQYLAEHSPDDLYEHVLLPALEYAEADARRGTIEEERRQYILENILDLLDDIPTLAGTAVPAADAPVAQAAPRDIIIVPSRDLADEIAGEMLRASLASQAITAILLSPKLLFSEIVGQIAQARSPLVIVSAVPPSAVRHARNLTKRLRHHLEDIPLVVGVWAPHEPGERTKARFAAAGCDQLVHQLAQAAEIAEKHLPPRSKPAPSGDGVAAEAARK